MGRSIPSFRLLIDIERLEWFDFRRYLCKADKEIFNRLFSIPKLYCHSLSNLSKPIIIESIIICSIFYNFKVLRKTIEELSTKARWNNNDKNNHHNKRKQDQFQDFPVNRQTKIENKSEYDNVIEDWRKFIDCLDKEDRDTFLAMITNCYDSYFGAINSSIKEKSNSCMTRTISLFMALILYQQKQINLIKDNQRFLDQ